MELEAVYSRPQRVGGSWEAEVVLYTTEGKIHDIAYMRRGSVANLDGALRAWATKRQLAAFPLDEPTP
jgi:hypothetical protein